MISISQNRGQSSKKGHIEIFYKPKQRAELEKGHIEIFYKPKTKARVQKRSHRKILYKQNMLQPHKLTVHIRK